MKKVVIDFSYIFALSVNLLFLCFALAYVVTLLLGNDVNNSTLLEFRDAYSYNFDGAVPYDSRNKQLLLNIKNYSKEEFHDFLLQHITLKNAEKYLSVVLEASELMQVDPFWMLSIVWTESHFNPHAESVVKAKGLMQLMPRTANFLYSKYQDSPSKTRLESILIGPTINTRLGAVYLKELLVMFNGNHKLATIAYNMGPTWVRKMSKRGVALGSKNNYLAKVDRSYNKIRNAYQARINSDFDFSI
jgi:soluble lytic murein transglycosylase